MVGTECCINWEMRFGWRKISGRGEISWNRFFPETLMFTSDRRLRSHGYVSLKIVPADATETRVLKYLMGCPQNYPGSQNVMKLLDHFTIHASNRSYDGLVLEVMGQNTFSVMENSSHGKMSLNNGREASRQVAMRLEYLHKFGIGHGGRYSGSNCFSDIHNG